MYYIVSERLVRLSAVSWQKDLSKVAIPFISNAVLVQRSMVMTSDDWKRDLEIICIDNFVNQKLIMLLLLATGYRDKITIQ